jgi:phage portal protein BeeE
MFNVCPSSCRNTATAPTATFSEASRAFLTMTMRPWLANFEQANQICAAGGLSVPGTRYQVEFDR